ncbi:hypothetical protein SGRIM128S_02650 [Streptomyces griseomycini]
MASISYQPSKVSSAFDVPVRSTERLSVFLRLSPLPLHHWVSPWAGGTISVVTAFFGSSTTSACGCLVLYSATPSLCQELLPALALS